MKLGAGSAAPQRGNTGVSNASMGGRDKSRQGAPIPPRWGAVLPGFVAAGLDAGPQPDGHGLL